MNEIRTTRALRDVLGGVREKTIGFIPTMGYLHEGHLSLIERARRECEYVIVSIFVNPTQFGVNEDLSVYPRDEERDHKLCEKAGVDLIFRPDVHEMYPAAPDHLVVSYPNLSKKLCGLFRPTHFDGVTLIMSKLLELVSPDRCYMGKKDGQQLMIIEQLARDLFPNIEIIGCSTVRESDGLAMSSRNIYLDEQQRERACEINKALSFAADLMGGGGSVDEALNGACAILTNARLDIQYCECVNRSTLDPARSLTAGTFLLCVAVMCDTTRLIDNYVLDVDDAGLIAVDKGVPL